MKVFQPSCALEVARYNSFAHNHISEIDHAICQKDDLEVLLMMIKMRGVGKRRLFFSGFV